MSLTVLWLIIAVEALLVCAMLGSQAAHAVLDRRRARRRPAIMLARRAVLDAVVFDEIPRSAVRVLEALRPTDRDEVLCTVALGVQSQRDPVFSELAALIGTGDKIDRDMKSRRWWIRHAALCRLTVLGMKSEAAGSLLGDRDPRVRAAAVRWMALTAPDETTAERLAAMLGDNEGRVRRSVMTALVSLGSAAAEALRPSLASDDRQTRSAASRVAAALGDPRIAADARPLVDDDDPAVQAAALEAMTPVLGPDDVEMVDHLLTHEDSRVRRAATEVAAGAELRDLVGQIGRRLTEDVDQDVREAAIIALEQLGPAGELLLRHAARGLESANG